jgi:3-oxoacyl-(acyl-carrier-protein) synthase
MRGAMAQAGLAPGDVDYVSAHATSTPLGDRIEARRAGALPRLHGRASNPACPFA